MQCEPDNTVPRRRREHEFVFGLMPSRGAVRAAETRFPLSRHLSAVPTRSLAHIRPQMLPRLPPQSIMAELSLGSFEGLYTTVVMYLDR